MNSAIADFENAIAYAHFKLRGGTKNVLLSAAAYVLLLVVATALVYSLTRPNNRRDALDALTYGLLGLQMLLVIGYGVFTTGGAVKTDLSSHLIESHRMMPLSSGRAIAGYLVGPPCQAYTFFIANVIVGLSICVLNSTGPTPTRTWLLRNAVLLLFAVFVFAVTVFWNFLGRNVGRYLVGLVVVFWISQGYLFAYVPAFYVLGSPFIGETVFAPSLSVGWTHGLAAVAQVALGLILLTAATRKYRRPHLPAFSTPLALLLLAAFVGIFGAGIFFWPVLRPDWRMYRRVEQALQFVSSTSVLMVLAMLPIASAARTYTLRQREANSTGLATSVATKPTHPLFTAVAAALLCLLVLIVAPDAPSAAPYFRTAVVIASFCLSFCFLLAWAYTITTRPTLLLVAWLILTWGGPLIADTIRYNLMDDPNGPLLATLSAASPYGALVQLWSPSESNTTPGLAFQIGLLVLTVVLYCAFPKRRAAAPSPPRNPPLPTSA
jgi:hypothetical protein